MIFFDLEFFVPKNDRNRPSDSTGSFIFNPAKANNIVLGGTFIIKDIISDDVLEEKSLWIWDFSNEAELLEEIYRIFSKEWNQQKQPPIKTLGKKIVDIVTVGFAIGRVDLPALFIRSNFHKIKTTERLYEVFLKTKAIDLGNISSFLFPNDTILYPKTANEVAKVLNADFEKFDSGKSVWHWFDEKKYDKIKKRNIREVKSSLKLYTELITIINKSKTDI